ncbi:BAR-domain-containing protein [Aureobasidium sp. EXF-8845]|nr:BAR-domain-containing protein [Aureobasidium sp. EXF-8845]KAI4856729.1 BAR-domain-containing protein [Aureobasidium sp. EXF-8846]
MSWAQGPRTGAADAPPPAGAVVAAIPQSVNKQSTPDPTSIRATFSPWLKLLAKSDTNSTKNSPIKSAVTMSWAGFKKNVNRAATQVMVKTGHVEQTHDRSYEVEERRYRVMENAATRLQKESKGYLDSLRAMTASQMRIAETIDAFYGDAGANDGVSRSYKQAVEDLDAETIKALDGPFRSTVLDPINRFCAYFPDINECIKKRNNKLLDYDRVRAQVKRLTEKPDKDVTKLPRTEKEAEMTRAAYDQLNEQLFNELPQLIELRVPYLDPSFEALVKIQLRFCAEAYSRMAQVQQYLDPDTRDQYANGNLDARVEQVLQEIRELSIAGTV